MGVEAANLRGRQLGMDWQDHLANSVPHGFIKPVFFAGLIAVPPP